MTHANLDLQTARAEYDRACGTLRNSLANRNRAGIAIDCRRVLQLNDELLEAERAVIRERCPDEQPAAVG